MAINVLIDTCILKRLISRSEFSKHLKHLKFLVDNQHVTMIAPDVLLKEWQRHREEEKKSLETELRSDKWNQKVSALFDSPSAEQIQEKIDEAFSFLLSQLDAIDDILYQKSIKLTPEGDLLKIIHEQRLAGKMPFGVKKKDNTNDALLIFTSLHYLVDKNETELYFLTDNQHEFATGSADHYVLHPEIGDHFPTIKTYYFTKIDQGLKAFENLGLPRYKEEPAEDKRDKIKNPITVDRNKSILNQIHEYLEKRFSDLHFIPKRLFTRHYPFIISDTFDYSNEPFTLITDHQAVFDVLTKLKVDDEDVSCDELGVVATEVDKEMARSIFKLFAANNITRISFKNEDAVQFRYTHPPATCNCTYCLYNRLEWDKIIREQRPTIHGDDSNSIQGRMRIAYGHYKIGDFYKCGLLVQELFKERKDKKDIILYILAFNLKHLAPILNRHYWKDIAIEQLALEFASISLDEIYDKVYKASPEYHQLLQWFHHKRFMAEALANMHEKVNQIVDHYYGQNTGFNSLANSLAEEYMVVERFLNRNSIIYDLYSEFQDLTDLLVQGLIGSAGCNPLMNGKLENLTDYWLIKLLFAGKAEVIQKYMVRFKLKEIQYNPTDSIETSFTDIIAAIPSTYCVIEQAVNDHKGRMSNYFWDRYSEIICNAITLLSSVSLNKQQFNTSVRALLTLLKEPNQLVYFRLLKHLRFLFQRRQHLFFDEVLVEFYQAAIANKEFHADRFFEILVGILNDKRIKVQLPPVQAQLLPILYIPDLRHEYSANAWFTIGYIYSSVEDDERKEEIRESVALSLSSKFDSGNYYLALMFDIIQPSEQFTAIYERDIERLIDEGQRPRPFANKEYYIDSRIDNYLNFCLKFDIKIPGSIIEKAPKMGAYYRWLFDIDSFDYEDFNSDWLYNHFTIYFKRNFRKRISLKNHLLKLMKEDSNTELERFFVVTYCYED